MILIPKPWLLRLIRAHLTSSTEDVAALWHGRPVSAVTTQFLKWCCEQLVQTDKRVLVLIWDNASWHRSQLVRTWLREHNQQVKQSGKGVRILSCLLPTKSPWLNHIEAK